MSSRNEDEPTGSISDNSIRRNNRVTRFYLRVSEFIQRIAGPCERATDLAKSAAASPGD